MCTTCGCGGGEARILGSVGQDAGKGTGYHVHADGTAHTHAHDDGHAQDDGGSWRRRHLFDRMAGASADAATGPLGAVHLAGMAPARIVAVERDILARNDALARDNRRRFADRGLFALNLVSSPGSGKTSLLVRTIRALEGRMPVAVIEGDQQTAATPSASARPARRRSRSRPARAAISTRRWWAARCSSCRRPMAACCSSRTSAIWSARRRSTWARRTRSRSFR